jgi:hypothetical protein
MSLHYCHHFWANIMSFGVSIVLTNSFDGFIICGIYFRSCCDTMNLGTSKEEYIFGCNPHISRHIILVFIPENMVILCCDIILSYLLKHHKVNIYEFLCVALTMRRDVEALVAMPILVVKGTVILLYVCHSVVCIILALKH